MQVDTGTFTASTLLVIWGVFQSFGLEYLWFVKDWFSRLESRKKQTVNAVGLFLVGATAYGLSYFGIINAFSPDLTGLVAAFTAYFIALGVAQGVHRATKQPS